MSPFEQITSDPSIKSWALHAAKDGKRMGYYIYISSNPDVLKDSLGMGVKVDLMGETSSSPEQAIEVGYLEYSRECKRKSNRVFLPKPIDKHTNLAELSVDDILKEIGF